MERNPPLDPIDKKTLTEADIRTKFIAPAITGEGGLKWNVMTQVLEAGLALMKSKRQGKQ